MVNPTCVYQCLPVSSLISSYTESPNARQHAARAGASTSDVKSCAYCLACTASRPSQEVFLVTVL